MTICLCMIVKNESHIIGETLLNIYNHIPLDYWVIADTGSTDSTMDIIRTFFNEKKVDGELLQHKWKNFAHNRTLVLEHSFQKADYAFIFDADDSIVGDIKLPLLTADKYMFTFGTELSYLRPLLINNRKKWWYTGVLHEYLDTNESRSTKRIEGDYHIHSGRMGARNKNPTKYQDDAKVLELAIAEEPRKDLKSRYAYYCGQSYRDAKDYVNAMIWFKKCIDVNGWNQERYCASVYLGDIYHAHKNDEDAQIWWCKSIQYDPERIEGIVLCAQMLQAKGNHVMVNALYHKFRDYRHDLKDKLFIQNYLYNYELEALNSLSAYYANDPDTGYECCKRVIYHSKNVTLVEKVIKHLMFYKTMHDKDQKIKSFIESKKYLNNK